MLALIAPFSAWTRRRHVDKSDDCSCSPFDATKLAVVIRLKPLVAEVKDSYSSDVAGLFELEFELRLLPAGVLLDASRRCCRRRRGVLAGKEVFSTKSPGIIRASVCCMSFTSALSGPQGASRQKRSHSQQQYQ
jgi:hypothetical protein